MHLSIEVFPNHEDKLLSAFQKASRSVPVQQTKVFVTHINGSDFNDGLRACASLKESGFQVVAHLAARNIKKTEDFPTIISRLNEIGVDGVLFLGGDNDKPECFESVQQLLDSGEVDNLEAPVTYFAAFPEGHLHAEDTNIAIDFIEQKIAWAKRQGKQTLLMTQMSFESQSVLNYLDLLRAHRIDVGLCVGFVAPCKLSKLVQMASLVGIEKALVFLKKQNMFKLLTEYKSDDFLKPLLASKKIAGLHCYAFGNYSGAFDDLAKFGVDV